MKLDWDEAKRALVLQRRGLDFADAAKVFAAPVIETIDERNDYGEPRYVTLGSLDGVSVFIVWTQRDDCRRIITMWQANAAERARYRRELGSGFHS